MFVTTGYLWKKMKEDSESTLTAVFLICKIKYDYVNLI